MAQPNPPAVAAQNPVAPVTTNIPQALSLGMIANTVESFSGKERVTEYFEKIRLRARLDNWDEKTTIDIVKFRLTGEAYRFLKTDPALESPTITFTEFEEKFIKRFAPIKIPGEALIKLSRCFQRHDESVSDYVGRLKILGAEILREDTNNSQAFEIAGLKKKCSELVLHQFKAGLKKEYIRNIGTLLMRTPDLTIDEAETYAKQEELNSLMLNNRQNSGSVLAVKCFKCGKFNHYANECRNPPRNWNNTSTSNYRSDRNNQSTRNFRQPNTQSQNFNAGNFGTRSYQPTNGNNAYFNRNRPNTSNNFNNSQYRRPHEFGQQNFNRQQERNESYRGENENLNSTASLN